MTNKEKEMLKIMKIASKVIVKEDLPLLKELAKY